MKNSTLILICSLSIAFILGVSAIISVAIMGDTLKTIQLDNTISVTGSAKTNIKADLAIWNPSISASSSDRQSAYQKVLSDREVVYNYLIGLGFSADEISISQVSTNTNYERDNNYNMTGRVLSYDMYQNFNIKSKNVELVDKASREITDLIGTNSVNIDSIRPEFVCTDLAEIKIKVIELATVDCVDRASSIVKSTNKDLGVILSAKTGVFQITPVGSTQVDDYGINDNSSIDKEISATVKATFKIK